MTTDPNFPRFPYYGQPIDMQLSILGSVSENLPANIGDQAVWMQRWGWIPKYHGALYAGATPDVSGHTPISTIQPPGVTVPQVIPRTELHL